VPALRDSHEPVHKQVDRDFSNKYLFLSVIDWLIAAIAVFVFVPTAMIGPGVAHEHAPGRDQPK
jgi:hypothetical protein